MQNTRMNTSTMRTLVLPFLLVIFLAILSPDASADETAGAGSANSDAIFPLYRDWFEERDIDLPLPYGVGAALVYMEREIEIEDVEVSLGNRPPESISDRIDFEMNNETVLGSAKFDVWVLPVLNVYMMLGRTESEARLKTTVMVQPPGSGEPVPVELDVKDGVDGPFWGAGMTFAAGHGNWFGLLDASYVRTDIDEFEGELDVWMASARLGQMFGTDIWRAMLWGGLFYVDTHRTLTFSE